MSEYEFSIDEGKSWFDVKDGGVVVNFAPGSTYFRIKPRTIKVNGFDVPESITKKPKLGSSIFIANISAMDFYQLSEWHDTDQQNRALQRGLVHDTKEAAIAHAKAMLGINPNGGDE